MRVAVIGAGALGLYYGAMLQRAGEDVRFLLRRDYEAIRQQGLTVTSPDGDFHLPDIKGFRRPEDMGEVDLVLVGLKTFANERMPALVQPLMTSETAVLTLQNGLANEEVLAQAFGTERVLGGVAFLCSNRGEPGIVHHLGHGAIRLGEFSGGLSARARSIADMFNQAGIQCEAVADLILARWQKLVWNIPFNGLCTLTGRDVGEILDHPPSRRLVQDLMAEVITGANAQSLSTTIEAESFIDGMIRASEPMGPYRPSMMIDRQEGRPLELKAIYGVPLQRAAATDVEMIRVRMLYALLDIEEQLHSS